MHLPEISYPGYAPFLTQTPRGLVAVTASESGQQFVVDCLDAAGWGNYLSNWRRVVMAVPPPSQNYLQVAVLRWPYNGYLRKKKEQ